MLGIECSSVIQHLLSMLKALGFHPQLQRNHLWGTEGKGIMQSRMALNFRFSCFHLPSNGITGVCHHIHVYVVLRLE